MAKAKKPAKQAGQDAAREQPTVPAEPTTREALRTLVREWLEIDLPQAAMVDGHASPLDYLCHSYFEPRAEVADAVGSKIDGTAPSIRASGSRRDPSGDCVVWANRGGGKTFLGAIATVLDLVFKPGIEIRILGGSLEQASRMHAHLRALLALPGLAGLVDGKITEKRMKLVNGSRVELLAQSQASVRGTRVQKLRCDEVELFDPEVWEAAQLTTRSKRCGGFLVRGAIECFSTMHIPQGIMHHLVQDCAAGKRTLFKWGVLDVLAACGPEHSCRHAVEASTTESVGVAGASCPLLPECQGRAKERAGNAQGAGVGHVTVDDAITMKSRVSTMTWEAEMLCLRPKRTDSVLPEFDPARHVVTAAPVEEAARAAHAAVGNRDSQPAAEEGNAGQGPFIAGMDFGFRGLTVVLWGYHDPGGVLWIFRERALAGVVLSQHVRAIADSAPRPGWVGIDPAGNAMNDQTGLSAANVLRKAGLAVRDRRMPMHQGLELIRARLAPADGGPTRLMVHRRCVKLIESLERYRYPVDRPESMEPVKDGFDHAVDALRYMIVNLDQGYATTTSNYLPNARAAHSGMGAR